MYYLIIYYFKMKTNTLYKTQALHKQEVIRTDSSIKK